MFTAFSCSTLESKSKNNYCFFLSFCCYNLFGVFHCCVQLKLAFKIFCLFVASIFICIYNIICQMSLYKDLINYDLYAVLTFCLCCNFQTTRDFFSSYTQARSRRKNLNRVKNFSYFCHVLIALCCLSSFFSRLFLCMLLLLILFCMQMRWKLRNIFKIFLFVGMKFMCYIFLCVCVIERRVKKF